MKKTEKTLNSIVNRIAKSHLEIDDISVNIPIKTALEEAVKEGERVGYNVGYDDAKQGCDKEICDCENSF